MVDISTASVQHGGQYTEKHVCVYSSTGSGTIASSIKTEKLLYYFTFIYALVVWLVDHIFFSVSNYHFSDSITEVTSAQG